MASLLVYYAHPGQRHSQVNSAMLQQAHDLDGISLVDLYALYPRHHIDIDAEQTRLLAHDIVLFQFPLFWYSTPSLVKEWMDLVLEYGFAYGEGGDKLAGKTLMLAITAGGTQESYSTTGSNKASLRTFLSPLEQTAGLCQMRYTPPYVLFGSLHARHSGCATPHVDSYRRLLIALRDDTYDFSQASAQEQIMFDTLPIIEERPT